MGPVICAVDDSDGARAALKVALELAARFGVNLVLVHAEPSAVVPGVSAAFGGQERLRTMAIEDAEKQLAWLAQEEKLDAVDLRAAVGNASDIVVEAARDLEAVFVVIGSHGRRGLRSAVLGSVSLAVVTSAPCPVVIVPPAARS